MICQENMSALNECMYVNEGRSEKPMFSYLRQAVPSYPAHHHSARTIARIPCFEAQAGKEEYHDRRDNQRMDELVFFLEKHRWKSRDRDIELTRYNVQSKFTLKSIKSMSHLCLGGRVSENLTMVNTRV